MKMEGIKKSRLAGELRDSARLMREGSYEIVFPVLFDLLFLLAYGAITGYFAGRVVINLYGLGASLLEAEGSAPPDGFVWGIMTSLLCMAAAVYISYVLLQGLSWRFSRAISGSRKPALSYIKKFSAATLPWFFLFIIYSAVMFALRFYDKESITSALLSYTFLILLAYFAFLSYALLYSKRGKPVREAVSLGCRRFTYLFPRFILALAVLYIIAWAVSYSSLAGRGLMLALGVLILLPLAAWARVYMHVIVKA